MKKKLSVITLEKQVLPALILAIFLFTACREVKEEGKYDNWRPRNTAYIDSLKKEVVFNTEIATVEQAAAMNIGQLYAIRDLMAGTDKNEAYIYCKKLLANPDGVRPLYTSTVKVFYYGTLITGDSFDGNFKGYSLLDQGTLSTTDPDKLPTDYNAPASFAVNGVVTGWVTALQYMRQGERWMIYLPYTSAYGKEGNSTIPGYSTLGFDVILDSVIE
ncbi:MAG: FKBP-type peptidyl-prolyl cis-trans isomerase [Prevotellaceae bacterium]|nr:FKBP-type peptidyl-prolyl cis-trans isomerase [Prevotellaceae bacterium]